jgi:hypothetical protein
MGLSSKKTKTTSNQTATTTPNVPAYAQGPAQDYYNQVGQLGSNLLNNIDQYKTPANALQQQAATAAQNLGGYQQGLNAATAQANAIGGAAAPQAALPSAPTAALARSQGYDAALIDPKAIAMAQAAQLGPAAQAEAARLGAAKTVNLGGYSAAQAGPVTFDNPVAQAQAASMLDGFEKYQNPATQQLVDATMAAYDDQSGRQAAQMQAAAAKNKAFGGSRYGFAEAQFAADTDRNRALTDAQLRDNAFRVASANSQFDAGNRQQTGLFNAGAQNDRTNLSAQLNTQNNQFNAGQTNDASRFTADAKNQGSLFNAGAQNDFTKTQAGFTQEANLFNAGESNQHARTQAGLDTSVSVANAGAKNQGLFANQNASNQAAQFGAGAANTAALANAGAQNQMASQVYGQTAQNNQFNAGMQADQFQRALQAAGLSSSNAIAGGQLAQGDAATQASIGNSLWSQQQANNLMPFQALGMQSGLMNPALMNAVSGQTVTGNGTSTTKQGGSLFDIALKAATALA